MLSALKPVSLILAMAYSYGAPLFDPVRPGALDLPLRGFHEDMTVAARDGFAIIRQLATAGSIHGSLEGRSPVKPVR